MRSLIFSVIVAVMLLLPTAAYADTEMFGSDLSLAGEDTYNEAVDSLTSDNMSINPSNIFSQLADNILGEIRECAGDLTILFILAAISGVINNVSKSLGKGGSGEAAFFACFTLMSAAALKCFTAALTYGAETVRLMTDFITKLSPLLMITIATSGGTVSAAAFSPVLSGAVYIVSLIMDKCLIPLAAFGAVLAVAGNINERVPLGGFTKLIKSVAKWVMAAVMTVFTAVSAVYGFSSPSLDAVGGKAVKFAVGSLVPVVGGFLSDTMETVVSGTRLMKNSVGTAGIIAVIAMCALPVIKIGVMQLMLKITAAIAEPLTDKRISAMMWEVSEAVTTVFALVVMVAVMFVLNISIMIAATNNVGV